MERHTPSGHGVVEAGEVSRGLMMSHLIWQHMGLLKTKMEIQLRFPVLTISSILRMMNL